ncbi:MAG: potassium-transporting ATPase subunit F [Bryobacterales bacterium]
MRIILMEIWYLIGAGLAVGLLVYLSVVLLKPELFS